MKFSKVAVIKIVIVVAIVLLVGVKVQGALKPYLDVEANSKISPSIDIAMRLNNLKDLKLPVKLQPVTIKQGESYELKDFIKEINEPLFSEETIVYQKKVMGEYTEPGTYDIQLYSSLPLLINQKFLGKTTLTIEELPKEEPVVEEVPEAETKVPVSTPQPKPVDNRPITERIATDNQRLGNEGRLYLPSFFSVALYQGTAQSIVDGRDSACFFYYRKVLVIGDHSNQGFNVIKGLNAGDNVYIKTSSGIRTFVVIEKTNGRNTGGDLVTADGRNLQQATIQASAVLYTCNDSNGNVTIVLLNEI